MRNCLGNIVAGQAIPQEKAPDAKGRHMALFGKEHVKRYQETDG